MKETMQVIHSLEEFKEASRKPMSVFVFSANWCPDCKFIEPFIPELMKKYDAYEFYYVDRDDCLEVCQELGVMGIPSFVAYANGVEIDRFVSRFRKTRDEIDKFLETLRKDR
ncbi:thioredoxin family protein [Amedibacillus sp. YH-ame6]